VGIAAAIAAFALIGRAIDDATDVG